MLKDTKSLGNNKAPACESRGFVHKKRGVHFDTPPFCFQYFAFGKIMRKYFFLLKNIEQNHSVCFPIQWIFPL